MWPRPDSGADRDQARAARNARRNQELVPARRRPGRRAAVDAGRERQRPARRPRSRAERVEARSRSSARASAPGSWTRTCAARARTSSTTSGSARCSRSGHVGFFGWLWFFARVVRRLGKEAKEDDSERGWLLVSIAASVAAFAVGMLTFDAFSFIQVTFLMFIFVGLGASLLAERPTPRAVQALRPTPQTD